MIDRIKNKAFEKVEKFINENTEIQNIIENLDKPLNQEINYNLVEKSPKWINTLDDPFWNENANYYENSYRELTNSEKEMLKQGTKWSDKMEGIEGCKINEKGVIKYPCRNEGLAGERNPLTGVTYERKFVEINGYDVEVVMPKFDAEFATRLPNDLLEAKDREQFKECNKKLYEELQRNPKLQRKFSEEQIEQIKDGIYMGGAPDGYTWHHDAEVGKMQLVDSDIHADSRHTGGKTLWGGGNENR